METLSPSYLTPEPSSAGNSVCFFSDSSCASSSWGSQPPTPRTPQSRQGWPASPMKSPARRGSREQHAALLSEPAGTSPLQAVVLRAMSYAASGELLPMPPTPSDSPAAAAALRPPEEWPVRSLSSTTLASLAELPTPPSP